MDRLERVTSELLFGGLYFQRGARCIGLLVKFSSGRDSLYDAMTSTGGLSRHWKLADVSFTGVCLLVIAVQLLLFSRSDNVAANKISESKKRE